MKASVFLLLVLLALWNISSALAASNPPTSPSSTNTTHSTATPSLTPSNSSLSHSLTNSSSLTPTPSHSLTNSPSPTSSRSASAATSINGSTSVNSSLSASNSPTPSCGKFNKCASEGDSCKSSWQDNKGTCTANNGTDCCAYGLLCISGTCQINNLGNTCANTTDCVSADSNENIICDSTCKYLSYLGDTCGASNVVCASGLACNASVCIGIAANKQCNPALPYDTCDLGFYCDTEKSLCQPQKQNNATCSYDNECPLGSFCYHNITANTYNCTQKYTLQSNQNCTTDDQCVEGLICYQHSATIRTCNQPTFNVISCTLDSDCASVKGSSCLCSQFTGNSYCSVQENYNFKPCAPDRSLAETCAAQNNCTTLSSNPTSCFATKCADNLLDLQECQCGNIDTIYGSCYYIEQCLGLPGWVGVVIVLGAACVFIVFVTVLYFALRKKRTYDTV